MDAKTVHPSGRAAVLAAYASLPGAALVTPALSYLLAQPPRGLALARTAPAAMVPADDAGASCGSATGHGRPVRCSAIGGRCAGVT
jgi:hypothetical protein